MRLTLPRTSVWWAGLNAVSCERRVVLMRAGASISNGSESRDGALAASWPPCTHRDEEERQAERRTARLPLPDALERRDRIRCEDSRRSLASETRLGLPSSAVLIPHYHQDLV